MKDYEDLADRIGAKRYSMVVSLLNRVSGLDMTYDNGTFFKMAIENSSSDIVQVLLEYFEQNQLSSYQKDSYEYAILKGKLRDILEKSIEYNELSSKMKEILSPYLDFNDYRLIHAAADGNEQEVKELLLGGNVDINLKDDIFENTALHFAYQNGHYGVVQLLIEAGADKAIVNNKGLTPKEVDRMQYITEEQCLGSLFVSGIPNNLAENSTQKVEAWLSDNLINNKQFLHQEIDSSTHAHSPSSDIGILGHSANQETEEI